MLFWGQRVHLDTERLLGAFALMVLQMPMDRVEKKFGIKAETMKGKLIWLLDHDRWEALDAELQRRWDIPQFFRSEFFRAIVVGREYEKSAFRTWGREFGRMDSHDRAQSRWLTQRVIKDIGARPTPQRLRHPVK